MAVGRVAAGASTAESSGGAIGFVAGVVAGALAALASGGVVLRGAADPVSGWGWFLLWSVVAPGLVSVALERRWPQFARGLGIAVVLVGCPINVVILVGLLGRVSVS